jgi:hypothetical protein
VRLREGSWGKHRGPFFAPASGRRSVAGHVPATMFTHGTPWPPTTASPDNTSTLQVDSGVYREDHP